MPKENESKNALKLNRSLRDFTNRINEVIRSINETKIKKKIDPIQYNDESIYKQFSNLSEKIGEINTWLNSDTMIKNKDGIKTKLENLQGNFKKLVSTLNDSKNDIETRYENVLTELNKWDENNIVDNFNDCMGDIEKLLRDTYSNKVLNEKWKKAQEELENNLSDSFNEFKNLVDNMISKVSTIFKDKKIEEIKGIEIDIANEDVSQKFFDVYNKFGKIVKYLDGKEIECATLGLWDEFKNAINGATWFIGVKPDDFIDKEYIQDVDNQKDVTLKKIDEMIDLFYKRINIILEAVNKKADETNSGGSHDEKKDDEVPSKKIGSSVEPTDETNSGGSHDEKTDDKQSKRSKNKKKNIFSWLKKKIKGHKNKDMHSKWRPIFEKYFGKVSKYFEKGIDAKNWQNFEKDIGSPLKKECESWFKFMNKMCGSSTAIKNEAKTPNTMLAILLASCCAANDLSKAKAICGGLKKITKNQALLKKDDNLQLENAEKVRENIKKALRSGSQIGKNLWNAIKNNENFKSLIFNDTNVSSVIEAAVQ
ncbi:MAG: hypothetical protein ACI4PR_04820 [Acutalibacteraceae bacterium]